MPRRTSACRRSRLLTTHVKRLRGGSAQCALAPISVATCEANPRTCRFSVSWLGRLLSMEMFRPRNADEGVDRDIALTTADITTTFMIYVFEFGRAVHGWRAHNRRVFALDQIYAVSPLQ